jgi:hypothetical protein
MAESVAGLLADLDDGPINCQLDRVVEETRAHEVDDKQLISLLLGFADTAEFRRLAERSRDWRC